MAYYSAYMMYSLHSSLVQLFGDDSDGFMTMVRTWKFVVEQGGSFLGGSQEGFIFLI
jgi:hypothetical protein